MGEKEKRGFYKPFRNARLEDEMQDWLKEEVKKYSSWNKFFKQLKQRYDEKGILGKSNEETLRE